MEPMAIADHRPPWWLLHVHEFGEELIFGNHFVAINGFRIVSIWHWGRIELRQPFLMNGKGGGEFGRGRPSRSIDNHRIAVMPEIAVDGIHSIEEL